MIRYHAFQTKQDAEQFLADLRANGGMGYYLCYNSNWHEVRELV